MSYLDIDFIGLYRNTYAKAGSLKSKQIPITNVFATVALIDFIGNKDIDNLSMILKTNISKSQNIGFNSLYQVQDIDTVLLDGRDKVFEYELNYIQNNITTVSLYGQKAGKQSYPVYLGNKETNFSTSGKVLQVLKIK